MNLACVYDFKHSIANDVERTGVTVRLETSKDVTPGTFALRFVSNNPLETADSITSTIDAPCIEVDMTKSTEAPPCRRVLVRKASPARLRVSEKPVRAMSSLVTASFPMTSTKLFLMPSCTTTTRYQRHQQS